MDTSYLKKLAGYLSVDINETIGDFLGSNFSKHTYSKDEKIDVLSKLCISLLFRSNYLNTYIQLLKGDIGDDEFEKMVAPDGDLYRKFKRIGIDVSINDCVKVIEIFWEYVKDADGRSILDYSDIEFFTLPTIEQDKIVGELKAALKQNIESSETGLSILVKKYFLN